jgi:adenine-specific DNA-methyltransferase
MYKIVTTNGTEYEPPPGRCWGNIESEFRKLNEDSRIWFGKDGNARPRSKSFLSENDGVSSWTWWQNSEVGHNQEAKKEINQLFGADNAFDTPKPERLLNRVLEIATNPSDLVLDSFAGSGTTGAVAQKMGRRWIMVELGDHCHTHIIPRLQKVIDGTDQGGISKSVNWKGGGGFRYYHLAPSLMEKDKWDNWVISKQYNSAMMAEAVCKLEGFNFAPSETLYWQHGNSTETDFIYVTTQTLTHEQLQQISEEVGESRSLLVCCTAFLGRADAFPNLTIKKIPNAVLSRCEWGHDDYSMNVENLPQKPQEPEQHDLIF